MLLSRRPFCRPSRFLTHQSLDFERSRTTTPPSPTGKSSGAFLESGAGSLFLSFDKSAAQAARRVCSMKFLVMSGWSVATLTCKTTSLPIRGGASSLWMPCSIGLKKSTGVATACHPWPRLPRPRPHSLHSTPNPSLFETAALLSLLVLQPKPSDSLNRTSTTPRAYEKKFVVVLPG